MSAPTLNNTETTAWQICFDLDSLWAPFQFHDAIILMLKAPPSPCGQWPSSLTSQYLPIPLFILLSQVFFFFFTPYCLPETRRALGGRDLPRLPLGWALRHGRFFRANGGTRAPPMLRALNPDLFLEVCRGLDLTCWRVWERCQRLMPSPGCLWPLAVINRKQGISWQAGHFVGCREQKRPPAPARTCFTARA